MAPNVGLGTEGPVQRGWTLWIVSVVGVVLSALFVLARLLQRITKTGRLGIDDYMIIASLVASGLLSMTECQAVAYGYGRHYATLPVDKRLIARKWFYGAQIMYKIVLMLNKISVVCLYYRIFAVSAKWFRTACHCANAFIVASGMAFIIGTVFQCTPIAAFWDKSIVPARCFQNEPWWISYAVIQITTDVVLLALPIRQVFSLSMTRPEKLGLTLVFCTGLFVTTASIIRATTLAESAGDPDPTYGPIPATYWAVIEANAGIICACLPMLRQPFLRLFGPLFGSRSRSKQQSYRLNSRSNQRSAGMRSDKTGTIDLATEFDRDSEEHIIGISNGTAGVADGYNSSERAGGIVVKSEFSVTRSASPDDKRDIIERLKTRQELRSKEGSVNEDKSSGRSTYLHI
ncbi:hypothetical protein BDV96DRAFT_496939 [Lophiotrema nucula]|uniref:Rhodopsin domain-containing protein n=1 Tax=Lophiotrema nucula TaxID=690887 RepID=A0A6A5Z1A4_9PLEO|nr:hypothetical protein BDV96DRAFT_496939 [Lophiotrema nucula]